MKNLKKLKAVLATELEAREVYQEAFDLVKDAEALVKFIKEKAGEARIIQTEIDQITERRNKALEDAEKQEADYYERSVELQNELDQNKSQAGKDVEHMLNDARKDVEGLKTTKKTLQKTIKDLERKTELVKSDYEKSYKKLEDIRAQLKSI